MTPESVHAVVVTYNRKELLRRCLNALLSQTTPVARILVVNNASTDGTPEMLAAEFPQVSVCTLPENAGGAGGFHAGFERTLATDADWLWAMDDDGVPESSTLERLVRAPPEAGLFRAPVVLALDGADANQLAFRAPHRTGSGRVIFDYVEQVQPLSQRGLLPGYVAPFNGVLIHTSAARRIGLPRAEFFMWGDEWDYVFRAMRLGIMPTTVLHARFWHPADRTKLAKLRFLGREWDVPTAETSFGRYLLVRNHGYIALRHRGLVAWVRHTLKYFLYYLRHDGWASAARALIYSCEGLVGRLSGHTSFQR